MDKSGANKAAIDAVNADRDVPIVVRQVKYLNNIVEQDHRAIKLVTNAIESINMSLRKVTKARSSFPTDEAVSKLFYLALNNISKKWTMPIRDWKAALNRFAIQFEDRVPQLNEKPFTQNPVHPRSYKNGLPFPAC